MWFCQKVLELAPGKKVIGKLVHNRVLGLLSRHENLLMTQIIENDLTVIIQIRTILWLKIHTGAKTNILSRNYQEFDVWKCEFCEKMKLWKCEFCENWDFKNVNFVKSHIFKLWIFV